DLLAAREKAGDNTVAIVRFEQLYPLDAERVREALAPFDGAELVWVQEEPENQGAWGRMSHALPAIVGRDVRVVSRPASASPASGLASRHQAEQAELVAK